MVARRFQQQKEVYYNDIFAPVLRWSTIQTVLVLAAKHDWSLHQMDVIKAFFNGTLNDEVFMEIPEGFPGAGDTTKVCVIKKALYGLRQVPKVWYEIIDFWFTSQGFTHSQYDPNLYYLSKGDKLILVLLYFDDLLLTGDNANGIERLKTALRKKFGMTNIGKTDNYLGREILRYNSYKHGTFLSQQRYIQKLLN